MHNVWTIIVVIVIILVVGWFLTMRNRPTNTNPKPSPSEIATYTPSTITQPSSPITETASPNQTSTAQLKAMQTVSGSGTAVRNFDGKTYDFVVNVILPAPPSGDPSYQAWISSGSKKTAIFMGVLQQQENVYVLRFSTTKNVSSYNEILITNQTASPTPETPSTTLLLGTFSSF